MNFGFTKGILNNLKIGPLNATQSPKHTCDICSDDFHLHELIFCSDANSLSKNTSKKTYSPGKHAFCKDCICEDINTNGIRARTNFVGTDCLSGCGNPILFSRLLKFLPKNLVKRIEESLNNENVKLSDIKENIERCITCNKAMEASPFINCIKCNSRHCRTCPCIGEIRITEKEPLQDQKTKLEKEEKTVSEMNILLNEVKTRRCNKCSLQIIRDGGCYKITCKCNNTLCYLCRASPIDYTHFCTCEKGFYKNGRCEKCQKTCRHDIDTEAYDEEKMDKIRKMYDIKVETGVVFVDITFLGENKRRKLGMDMNFPTSIFHLVSCVLTYLKNKPEEYTIQEVHLYNEDKSIFELSTKVLSDIPMYNCLRCQIQVRKSNNNTVERMLQEFISTYPEGRPQLAETLFIRRPPVNTESTQNICRLCMNKAANAVIFPCAHAVICYACGEELKKTKKRCPICQGNVDGIKKLNFVTFCAANNAYRV